MKKLVPIIYSSIKGLVISLSAVVVALTALLPSSAAALSGSDFHAGHIIDDSVFINSSSMPVANIQDFLNAKRPTCDTNGTTSKSYYYNSTTGEVNVNGSWVTTSRATYGQRYANFWNNHTVDSVGNKRSSTYITNQSVAPYVCLKSYVENPSTHQNNLRNPGASISGGQSAAQIIYNAAQTYHINPQVLLTTLQKEQGLVTDDWPWMNEYRIAMGYGCPDTAACDSTYYGFANQVTSAARQFRRYLDTPTNYNYVIGNNTIRYSPSSSCTSSTVYIQNQATAALYDYTPYQPNAAALKNVSSTSAGGLGDSCSSYGNRNFWWYFNTWFGDTIDGGPISYTLRIVSPVTSSPVKPVAGEPVTITYTVKNYDSQSATFQNSVVQCRLNSTTNCDPGWDGATTLAAGAQKTFTVTFNSFQGGNYRLTPYFSQNGAWYRFGADTVGANFLQYNVPDMRLVSTIATNPANPIGGQTATTTYTVKNYGTQPVVYQNSILQCRFNTTTNCDPAMGSYITINPGGQYTFTNSFSNLQGGTYTLTPYFLMDGSWYTYRPYNGSSALQLVVPDVRLTGPIGISPSQPIPGQPITVTYTVQNYGTQTTTYQYSVLQCRFNSTTNCDPEWGGALTLNPGDQHTFSIDLPAVKAGTYTLTPYFMQNNRWYRYGGTSPNSVNLIVPAYVADVRLTSPIAISPVSPIPGQPVTVTYTVQNYGDKPAIFQTSVLQCRFNTNTNCDPSWDAPVTIDPGAQHTFSIDFPAVKAGTYVYTPYYMQNDHWYHFGAGTTGSNSLKVVVPAYVADVRLVSPIAVTPSNPSAGQNISVSYTFQNYGDKPAIFQTSVLQCRFNTNTNCDPSWDGPLTVDPGNQHTFTLSFSSIKAGTYVFTPYFMQNNIWHKFNAGTAGSNYLQLVVH